MLSVSEVSTAQEAMDWGEYVVNHPQATGYHLTAWRRVTEDAFGQQMADSVQ